MGASYNLSKLRGTGEGRVGCLHAHVNRQAAETEARVAKHGAGKESGFKKDLESIANAEDEAARAREFFDAAHHGRKARDGASAKIVTVGKSTGKNDDVRRQRDRRIDAR